MSSGSQRQEGVDVGVLHSRKEESESKIKVLTALEPTYVEESEKGSVVRRVA